MKIGVRAHDYGKMKAEQLARTLHDCGYECAQLALPRSIVGIEDYADITYRKVAEIREAFENNQIEIAVFSCYMDLSNPKEEVRRYALDTLKKCLAYGKEAGAHVVGTETSYSLLDAEGKKHCYPYMMDAIKEAVEEAARLDMRLAIEPVHWHPLDSLEVVQDVLEKVNEEKYLRLIFDASNVLKQSDADDQEAYWTVWLEGIGKYIEAMHIKDFVFDENGKTIPTPLGQGILRYEAISRWLRANKPEMYLLREEMNPAIAEAEIAFMKKL